MKKLKHSSIAIAISALCLFNTISYAETGSVVFWNKLDSKSGINNSEIGPEIQMTSYKINDWDQAQILPAQFGNGLFINHGTDEGWLNDGGNFFAVNMNNVGVTPEKGTLEFWFKFKYSSSVHNHALFFMFADTLTDHFPDNDNNTNAGISAGWNGWDYGTYGKRYQFGISNSLDSSSNLIQTPDYSVAPGGELEFNDGTIDHFAFVWNVDGIDGAADTLRLYVNGELVAFNSGTWTTTGGFDPYLYLGSRPSYGPRWDHYYNAVKGVMDNLIIRDYAKTNFSDRFEENPDIDLDTIPNDSDNCPNNANTNQADYDSDGLGDVCDDDVDGDGVVNESDMCAFTPLDSIVDLNIGCSIAQLCPCEGPKDGSGTWKNHGKYVSCVRKSAENFVQQGLISVVEKDTIVSQSAQSDCGLWKERKERKEKIIL